jgi:hypothetical protein
MRHQNHIYAYIHTLVPQGADAEDIIQVYHLWRQIGNINKFIHLKVYIS